MTRTLHELATAQWMAAKHRLQVWTDDHSTLPGWLRDKILQSKRRTAKRAAVAAAWQQMARQMKQGLARRNADYRDDMAMFARALRPVVSVRDEKLRALLQQVRNLHYCWGYDATVTRALDDSDLGGEVGRIRQSGKWTSQRDGHEPWVHDARHHMRDAEELKKEADYGICQLLMQALRWECTMEIGRTQFDRMMRELDADPKRTIGGYLAASLQSMLADPDHTAAYEDCAGGELHMYIRKTLSRDQWLELLERAPKGKHTETAIQCFPHEARKERACRNAGLFETFRMNDSIYSGTPQQVAAVLAELAE